LVCTQAPLSSLEKDWLAMLPVVADGGVKVMRMEILSGTDR
jgi:hypothetical protein